MNILRQGLKRLSSVLHDAFAGGHTPRTRRHAKLRTTQRTRLAVEELEQRLTPSGAALTLNAQTLSSTQVYLYWSTNPSGGIYDVNELDELNNGAATTIDVTGNDEATISNLDPYVTYTFQIVGGGGITSNIQSITTFPTTPTITATVASWAQVNLSWGYYGPAVTFYVTEELNGAIVGSGSAGTAATNTPSDGSDDFTGLNASSTYSFSLTYWLDSVEFTSNVQTVTTPSTAVSLTATPVSSTQVNLSWNSVFEASDYLIYEQVNGGAATNIGSSTGTSYPVAGLSPYTTYTFQVKDIGPWGINSTSQTVNTLPSPLSLTGYAASPSQVNLSWNGVAGATDYVLYENGTPIKNLPGTTSYAVTGLTANTNYTFQVDDVGPWGLTQSNSQSVTTLTAAPVFTATAISPTQVELTWNSVPGAIGYVIDEMVNGAWQDEAIADGTSSVITNLSPNTTYQFDVGSVGAVQPGTSWGTAQSVATLPLAPTLNFGGSTANSITLRWNSVSCNGYILANSSLVPVAYLTSNATSCTVSGLSPNTVYSYKLGAYNGSGYSWSSVTAAMTLPATPALSATAESATEIILLWNDNAPGAGGYIIDESVNGVLQQTLFAGVSATSCTVTGLSPNTTYTFQIGTGNPYGYAWSSAASALTFPIAPTFTLQAISMTQVNVAWNTVPGATGYTIAELINGSWQTIATVSAGTTSYSVTGLTASTSYEFEVGAFDASGTSWAAIESVMTLAPSHKLLPG